MAFFDPMARRHFLRQAGAFGALMAGGRTLADESASGGSITRDFPQKGGMILQRTRPPLLETPFEVYDQGVFTPNDRFFVRWHWAAIPTKIDVESFRLTVRGHVEQSLSLSLAELLAMKRVELAAVNQCSGNSRSLFQPRVPGAQWGNGAMGNARWVGVRLKDVLDRAGVKAGAVAVRSSGLDEPLVEDAPRFRKSLDIDHARDGEVMIAFQMNDTQLPLLNGFPIRLVVPGWYSTYWIKMLCDIDVLEGADDNYWSKSAYRIPDTPYGSVKPGESGFATVPINRMVPRSFITNVTDGARIESGAPIALRGIAFGGDRGVARVELSTDGGQSWAETQLEKDEGRYSFRRWRTELPPPSAGALTMMVRCTNTQGLAQPAEPNWNGSGFMRNVVERVSVTVA